MALRCAYLVVVTVLSSVHWEVCVPVSVLQVAVCTKSPFYFVFRALCSEGLRFEYRFGGLIFFTFIQSLCTDFGAVL
jgi:hypothetical protein